MEKFVLIDNINPRILDSCISNSVNNAQAIFSGRGWAIGDAISEADWMSELELNKSENQSTEQ